MSPAPEVQRLCYLDTTRLESPLVHRLDVRTGEDTKIGTFDGIILDPAERRVRYLVVDDGRLFRHHRFLVPYVPARVDTEHQALRIEADEVDVSTCKEFDPDAFPSFSDDDFMTALFAREH